MASRKPFHEDTLISRDFIPSQENRASIEHHIATVEKEIQDLDESIIKLKLRRSERAKVLQKLHSAPAPIRKLPLESLTEIFGWLLALYRKDGPEGDQITLPWKVGSRPWQFDLMHTCFKWRQAACGSPSLWSNFLIVSPCDEVDDHDVWVKSDEWIARLLNAQKHFPPYGSLTVGVDIGPAQWNSEEASELAVKHLYNPVMRPGRSISAAFRGYSLQIYQLLHSKFEHPELLEHVIMRDLGEHQIDEMWADFSHIPMQQMPNLFRLDWIAETEHPLIHDGYSDDNDLPRDQLTHLVIRHSFPCGSTMEMASSLHFAKSCCNLIHLTLIMGFHEDDSPELEDLMFDPDDDEVLELPLLQSLFVSLDMRYFLEYFKLPSLTSLEIWSKKDQSLMDIQKFIIRSGCSIESFIEDGPIGQSHSMPYFSQQALYGFLGCLNKVKTLKTYTLFDRQTLSDIASGRFLPSIEVLQCFCSLPTMAIVDILNPRFRRPAQGEETGTLKELTINCLDPTLERPAFYMGGTVIRVVHEASKVYRENGLILDTRATDFSLPFR